MLGACVLELAHEKSFIEHLCMLNKDDLVLRGGEKPDHEVVISIYFYLDGAIKIEGLIENNRIAIFSDCDLNWRLLCNILNLPINFIFFD